MIDQLLKYTKEQNWKKTSELLYRHWTLTTPGVFPTHLEQPWENVIDEKKIEGELLYPLSVIFCAEEQPDCKEKDASLKKLCQIVGLTHIGRPGQICGRMFKNGEPNYTCKDCATDGTCVLCHECFVNSSHTSHKYKMHTSLGSGYCDCGDSEAWARDFACKLHAAREEENGQTDQIQSLPTEIVLRTRNLSVIVLKFAIETLCWKETETFPNVIDEPNLPKGDPLQTILFNDETHTYDAVIRALELAIHCTENQAMRLATIVDREGRSIVKTGSRDICEQVKLTIERRTLKDSNRRTQKSGPLEVKIYRASLVAFQNLAVRLLNWLSAQVLEFPPLSGILSEILLFECGSEECGSDSGKEEELGCLVGLTPLSGHSSHSHCVRLMRQDRKLWKAARSAFHKLLMATVLMELEHKNTFGRLLVQNYKTIFEDFISDDHDYKILSNIQHSVSVAAMTVQVFTVPTIAKRLIIEENVLDTVLRTLVDFSQRYVSVSPHNDKLSHFDFATDPYPVILKRALYMLSDAGYLLTVIPRPDEWTLQLRSNFLRGAVTFLRFLRDIQGMDEVKRQSGEHQLMESEWETAFNIFLRLQDPLSLTLTWARTDLLVHRRLFAQIIHEIHLKIEHIPEFAGPRYIVQVNGVHADCIPFDVSRQSLSLHQPLWRFIAGLFAAPEHILAHYIVDDSNATPGPTIEASWSASVTPANVNLRGLRTILMEMPLRVLVLQAQSNAQLWRRNGFSLVNQVHNYSSQLCRTEMYDRDILLLQAMGAIMDKNRFLVRILDRFGLAKWAEIGFEDAPSPLFGGPDLPSALATPEDSGKIYTLLAEELLQLLIHLLSERYVPGVSDCTPMQCLEREIVQFLCTGPKLFSQIERIVPNEPAIQRLSLETAVRSVADFRRPTTVASGQFHLKEALRPLYSPFFFHFGRTQLSQAEQFQKQERANLGRDLVACPPPVPPPFAPYFAPLVKLVESPAFIKLLRVVFERMAKRSRFVNDGLFHCALFLTGMALNEERRGHTEGTGLRFLELAEAEGIFAQLSRLQNKPEIETHGDLLWWVMKTFSEVKALYSGAKVEIEKPHEVDTTPITDDKRAQRAAIAARKRQLALDRMKQLQNSFKTQNISLNDSVSTSTAAATTETNANDFGAEDSDEIAILPLGSGFPVCLGVNKSEVVLRNPLPKVTCILCQEDEAFSFTSDPIVCAAFLQNSRLFSFDCDDGQKNFSLNDHQDIFSPISVSQGLHISTCSHLMHFTCYNTFMNLTNSRERSRARQQVLNARMLNTDAGEYLCPLCKRLSNCALPLFPPVQLLADIKGFSTYQPDSIEPFHVWLSALGALVIQPLVKNSPKSAKGHSRKRSHSERSLLDLAKNVGIGGTAKALGSASKSPSSVASLPAALASAELPADAEMANLTLQRVSSGIRGSSISSLSEALMEVDRPQDSTHHHPLMFTEGGPTIFHQILGHVFNAARKTFGSQTDQNLANIPSTLTDCWRTVAPFLESIAQWAAEKDQRDATAPVPPDDIRARPVYTRFVETLAVLKACSFLLRSVSGVLAVEKKPLFGAVNTRQRDCVNAFVRISALVPFNCQPSGLRVLVSRLLSPLLAPISAKQRPLEDPSAALLSEVNIMQVDMLTLAVQLCVCIGWTLVKGERLLHNTKSMAQHYDDKAGEMKFADGSVDEIYVIRLTLLAHLFQILCCLSGPHNSEEHKRDPHIFQNSSTAPTETLESVQKKSDEVVAEATALAELLRPLMFAYTGQMDDKNDPVGANVVLYQKLHDAAVLFLRPLAILYNALTLTPPPESLKDPSLDQLGSLCRYLGLPCRLSELFSGPEVGSLFQLWSEHVTDRKSFPLVHLPLKINKLIDLPENFSDLINIASKFKCPQVQDLTTAIPTLCLSCGELLCSQSYCCQRTLNGRGVGACTYHMDKCNGSNGMFLRIRDCQVIFLTSFARGCFKYAPYVDEFGETDPGFRRGNPMHLNRDLYWKIQRLWLHQEVAEEVINQYELNHRNLNFDWHHF